MNGIEQFNEEAKRINVAYHGLSLVVKDGMPIVSGEFFLVDKDGVQYEPYSIEIHPVTNYPRAFPYVFEIGGRIPRNVEWHVFESDGHCCLKAQPEEILICKTGLDLSAFIEKEMKPYFFNQLYRERHGYFLKERTHGIMGEFEFFFDLFRTANLLDLYKFLRFIRYRVEPNRTEKCFCGSGEKYRRCHRDVYRILAEFTNSELDYFIDRIAQSDSFILQYPLVAYTHRR